MSARELQVYACSRDGRLAHASPQEFRDTESLPDQCRRHELIWRRWRDLKLSLDFPRTAVGRWRNLRKDTYPLATSPLGEVWTLVHPETGAQVATIPIEEPACTTVST